MKKYAAVAIAITQFPFFSQAMNLRCGSQGYVSPGSILTIRSILSPVRDPNWKYGTKMFGPAAVKVQSSTIPVDPNGPVFAPNYTLRGMYSSGPSFIGHFIDGAGKVTATLSVRGNQGVYRSTSQADKGITLNCSVSE